ncbi:hypothetical protein [Pseudomonas mandelii]|uniref:hypothetical protein n=1 Tax=Pseudomonas mandelii TaxID=75612 RepID=UPI00209E4BE6|nr:hypothetical protein [Pseudomonas mandelii]MCO8313155.1 hypothetical protein [Pseudomonas mandelii]
MKRSLQMALYRWTSSQLVLMSSGWAALKNCSVSMMVMEHIARGNKALLVEFPELVPAEKGVLESS